LQIRGNLIEREIIGRIEEQKLLQKTFDSRHAEGGEGI
jgi:hypothetical protein